MRSIGCAYVLSGLDTFCRLLGHPAFEGIVLNAVILTVSILISLLFVYKSGLIKVTENFKLGVAAATGGIALVYLFSIFGSFFGINISSNLSKVSNSYLFTD